FSPDGKRLAFSMASGPAAADIWVKDLDQEAPSRLSFLSGVNRDPVWTPDGKNIVFESTSLDAPGLYWIRSDGSGQAERLTDGVEAEVPSSLSRDGKRLAVNQRSYRGYPNIFTLLIEGDLGRGLGVRAGKTELFLDNGQRPAFSPDGRWLAYQSTKSGP